MSPELASNDAAAALFAAIHAHNLAGVQALIRAAPPLLRAVSPSGLSPVLFAVYYQRPSIVQFLVAAGASLDIFEASAAGETQQVQALLTAQPALVNLRSSDGFSPLGLAALFGREETALALLARGADIHAVSQNALRAQPLHLAVNNRHARLAELLVGAGAEVNADQGGQLTPLISAAQQGDAELTAFLLSRGADAAARTTEGRTARSFAAEENHVAVLNVLPLEPDKPEESQNASGGAVSQTSSMNDKEITGVTGAVTGFDTPDPKQGDPDTIYTSTPADDRVSSSDQSTYQAANVPDAKEVTGQFDHLATRDVTAMETALQPPEYQGAVRTETVASPELLDAVLPSAGLDAPTGLGLGSQSRGGAVDQNPDYTPPSKMVTPHVMNHPTNLSDGEANRALGTQDTGDQDL